MDNSENTGEGNKLSTSKGTLEAPPKGGFLSRIKERFGARKALEEVAGIDNEGVSAEEIIESTRGLHEALLFPGYRDSDAKRKVALANALLDHNSEIREGKPVFVQVAGSEGGNEKLVGLVNAVLSKGERISGTGGKNEGFYRTRLPGVYRYDARWENRDQVRDFSSGTTSDAIRRSEAEFIVLTANEKFHDLRALDYDVGSNIYSDLSHGSHHVDNSRVIFDFAVRQATIDAVVNSHERAQKQHDEYMEGHNRQRHEKSVLSRGGD